LIDEYAPGFSTSIIGYDMLTPPDLERVIGLTGNLAIFTQTETYAVDILSASQTAFSRAQKRYAGESINETKLCNSSNWNEFVYCDSLHFELFFWAGGNIFHGAMGLDSLFLMRPAKGW